MLLSIYKLDAAPDENAVCILSKGEHNIGRGLLLECNDKRAAKDQAVIKVDDDSASITSTHQNPCFYQSVNSKTIIILPRDSPVDIKNDDKFGLFPDKCWFKFQIKNESSQESVSITTMSEQLNSNENNNGDYKNASPNEDVQIIATNPSHNSLKRLSETDVVVRNKLPRIENNGELVEETKVKFDNNEGAPPQNVSDLNSRRIKNDVSDSESENDNVNEIENVSDEISAIKNDGVSVTVHENVYGQSRIKNDVSESESENDNVNDNKNITNDDVILTVPENVNGESNREARIEEVCNSGSERNEDVDVVMQPTDEKKTTDPGESSGSASTSSANSNTKKRDKCWYGAGCYRKSANHRSEYCHPGDADYVSDPNDDHPVCRFGADCYRKNKDHRREYKHPRGKGKPDSQKRQQRKRKVGTTAGKAKKQKDNDESLEDDYDFDDPFLDDGSEDEYEEESWSEDDSDEDWKDSPNSSDDENTKDLLKEAKRFTRKKK